MGEGERARIGPARSPVPGRAPATVGLLGYGPAGAILHAPLIAATPGLELRTIVTADPARAAAAARAYPGAAIHPDPAAVLAGDLDLVVIATPVRSHVPLAERAIDAGSAVVIDKPLAAAFADGAGVVDGARSRGVALTVFQNRRWDSGFRTVRKVLAGGRLGRPYRYEARFEVFRPVDPAAWQESPDPLDGGGVLLDFGAHLIDQACVLLGRPTTVRAEIHRRRPGSAVDDDVLVSLAFGAGPIAHLWLSRAARASGPSFRLIGADAAFEIDGADPQWDALRRGERPGDPGWGRHPTSGTLSLDDGEIARDIRIRPLPGAWETFYAELRDALAGEGPIPVDPTDAVAVLRIVEAARLSAATGRTVALDDAPSPAR
jgi:predicted dehydrogenase